VVLKEGWTGRYFEDFEVGEHYRHRLGRTISEADNTWFTLLTLNTNQVHFNAHVAAKSAYGRLLVNSGFSLALVLGLSVSDTSENAIANLGWDEVRLPHPVFIGDTMYAESLVVAKRESKSRPNAGIVKFRTRGLNQDGDVCVTYVRDVLIYRRSATSDKGLFPVAKDPIAP
jgi:acyl dehydratase